MNLRALIQGGRPPGEPRTPATLATLATVGGHSPQFRPSVATVATVADPGPSNGWAHRLRSLPPTEGLRWDLAADALEVLLRAGAVEKALGLGWDARELIGVCRTAPHDSPSRAGLIFSMRPGDTVTDVRRAGCIIAYATVRHIWKRVPLAADGSIRLPWELTA
jgi:hypothetical protein